MIRSIKTTTFYQDLSQVIINSDKKNNELLHSSSFRNANIFSNICYKMTLPLVFHIYTEG